jgi:copper chaperone CopZ
MSERKEIVLDVRGMTCDSCAAHVTRALQRVPGVSAVTVLGWQSAQATVVAEPDVDVNALTAALDAAGYSGTIRERHSVGETNKTANLPAADRRRVSVAQPAVKKTTAAHTVDVCPQCGQRGKPVDRLTIKAMLAVPLTQVRPVTYLFCRTADCPVVYFAEDGEQTFTTAEVRERVHQKEPDADDVFVCYCFRHTPKSIRAEWVTTGHSTVVDAINAGIQAGQCACEVRNPQGSCCLGNVRAVVKRVTTAQQTLA